MTQNKTKVKDKSEIKFSDPTSKGELSTTSPTTDQKLDVSKLALSKDQASKKLQSTNLPQGSVDIMRHFSDKIKDLTDTVPIEIPTKQTIGVQEQPKPVTPNTLPAVINKSLSVRSNGDIKRKVDVDWISVRDLPGYAVEQIRAAFRPLFNSIMSQQLEKICVTTNLVPGLASKADIKQLIGYLMKYGIKDDTFSLEAFDIDPAMYHINKANVVNLDGVCYLILQEHMMGQEFFYIYSGAGRETNLGSDQKDLIS